MSRLRAGPLLGLTVRLLAATGGEGQRRAALAELDSVSALQREVILHSEAAHAVGGHAGKLLLPTSPDPQMFVAIFSAAGEDYTTRRDAARQAWSRAGAHRMTVRFMVCSHPWDLREHWDSFRGKDMVFLDCDESYGRGFLTRKAVKSLRYYLNTYPNVPYYFKTDDDTFVRPGLLLSRVDRCRGVPYVYGGVLENTGVPDRDPQSRWYESVDIYSRDTYPRTALGGPGYLLSRRMVEEMFNQGLPEKYPLYNEDRAIAVWVKTAQEAIAPIMYIHIEGENGYSNHCLTIRFSLKWKDFPWVLFHKLSETELKCISKEWNDEDDLNTCFCGSMQSG